MEIMKLIPTGKDYLWGGTRLREEYGKKIDLTPLAETWECSVHPDGPSYVANGIYKGQTLAEVLNAHSEYLGTKVENGELPVLVKFIDAKKDLSVQVHPDDVYAREHEGDNGKTEMWYVIDADEGASLIYGFQHEVTEEILRKAVDTGTLDKHLQKIQVHKGDTYFVPAGTVHGIGKGILVAEIQESSNVTYRVYDYGRKGPDGKERELHVDKALQVTKREPAATDRDFGPHVASCEYFTVDKVILDGLRRKKLTGEADGTSFVSVLVMSGAGKITASGQTMEVKKGDSIFITAGSGEYELEGDMEALLTTV